MTKLYTVASSDKIHPSILAGAEKIYNLVAKTLGPRGKNIILRSKEGKIITTKDGVTVAKFCEFEDKYEDTAARILKQASEQTNLESGDGTTTSLVLAYAILKKANEYLINNLSSNKLKNEIEKVVDKVLAEISKCAIPIKSEQDILNIATISANGDIEIGQKVLEAATKAGKDGTVSIDKSSTAKTTVEIIDGFRLDTGYVSPRFVNNERLGICKYDNPLYFVSDFKFTKVDELMPVLQFAARINQPLAIFADEVSEQALAALIYNSEMSKIEGGGIKVVAVNPPRFGQERRELLIDLATATGAKFWSREMIGVANLAEVFKPEHFGKSRALEIGKYFTTIIGGNADEVLLESRVEALNAEIKQTPDLNECEKLQERVIRLSSGAAIIKVGGITDIEVAEKIHRYEDALEALKSAQEEGVVPGGGSVLAKISARVWVDDIRTASREERAAVDIIRHALIQPFYKIAENAGEVPEVWLNKILAAESNETTGVDFQNLVVGDLYKLGVIDPVKVVKCGLKNAASVACSLLMTGGMIIET